jgi:uncharacterized membrane protein
MHFGVYLMNKAAFERSGQYRGRIIGFVVGIIIARSALGLIAAIRKWIVLR